MGKLTQRKKRPFFGDWSQFNPKFAMVGFVLFIVGIALLASGRLDSELIGLGMFGSGIALGYLSIRKVWE